MRLSVVIPSHNRIEHIRTILALLAKQTQHPEDFEVVLIDDGPSYASGEHLPEFGNGLPYRFRCGRQRRAGPGSARNRGVLMSEAPLVLFLDDDIEPDEQLIEAHVSFHEKHPEPNVAMVGRIEASPHLPDTPFMRFMGPQMRIDPKPGERLDYTFFWTAHVSLKREFLLQNSLFDESYELVGHEDLELGYRLEKRGLKIIFNESAVVSHNHPFTLRSACDKHLELGRSFEFIYRKVPDPRIYKHYGLLHWKAPLPVVAKQLGKGLLRKLLFNRLTVPHLLLPLLERAQAMPRLASWLTPLYWPLLGYHFRKGLAKSIPDRRFL